MSAADLIASATNSRTVRCLLLLRKQKLRSYPVQRVIRACTLVGISQDPARQLQLHSLGVLRAHGEIKCPWNAVGGRAYFGLHVDQHAHAGYHAG